jgi:two-component system, OmpR family, response regulator MprA
MRILVVDDDRALRDALRRALSTGGFEVALAENGQQGLAMIAGTRPDAVVLDVTMPGLDGLAVCRRLRAVGDPVPVLMLTGRDRVEDRVDGLGAGADDYLVKPFDLRELKARLHALLRRARIATPATVLAFAELRLDADRHGLVVGDRFVLLTATELKLLELLLRNPGMVLTREVIHQRIWGCDFGPESNALRVYVGYLRRKLEAAGARPLIHTLRGVGYVLREPDSSI